MKITDMEKLLQSALSDEYQISIENTEEFEDYTKVGVQIEQVPRTFGEIMNGWDEDFSVEDFLEADSDNSGAGEYLVRQINSFSCEEIESLKGLDFQPGEKIFIGFCGDNSLPDYNDDEADGYFNGYAYITVKDAETLVQAMKPDMLRSYEGSIEALILNAKNLIIQSRAHGSKSFIAKDEIIDLVRAAAISG